MREIAIIEPIGGHGGNDIYAFNLIRAIGKKDEYSAVLYTCDETFINGMENVKLTFKNIYGKTNKYIRGINYLKGIFSALIDAKNNNASVIHLHFFSFSFLEYFNLFVAKKLFGFQAVVGTVHDVESFEKYAKGDLSRNNYEKFFFLLDGIVVHTEYARRELINHISSDVFDANKIRTIYACDLDYDSLNANFIEKSIAREYLKLPQERKIVLFFGQIKKVKGLDLLLNALVKVSKHDSSVLLVIAGKVWKDDYSEYTKIIEEYGFGQFVNQRIGFIDNADVPYYFNAADIIVLPYRKIYNSGVLIRAMSFGTPVVASDFGPFEEFIIDGENGYLFETGSVESLAGKLEKILTENSSFEHIALAEKKFINEHFSIAEIGKKYHDFYNFILEEK